MNNTQIEAIKKVISSLDELRGDISPIASELRGEYDDLDDKKKESEKGEALDSSATALEEADDTFDDLISKLSQAMS